uniref:HSF-type DNA-binding domain-containing protein n=1 Tax=Timema douglasi TaxID=61478 RepID=A0A7R8VX29_TIMDO|nr:unnamed protein product [Timema douglasi]
MHSTEEIGTNVPAFLAKLWKIVDDPETNELICWSPIRPFLGRSSIHDGLAKPVIALPSPRRLAVFPGLIVGPSRPPGESGSSFVIRNQANFSRQLLPLYYKHNNMASFIRQLNMYGFHKVVSIEGGGLKVDKDEMEFAHQFFLMGRPYLLENIKRKVISAVDPLTHLHHTGMYDVISVILMCQSSPNQLQLDSSPPLCPGDLVMTSIPTSKGAGSGGDLDGARPNLVSKVLTDVKRMKDRQDTLNSQLLAIKRENQVLWREVALLRQKHHKQQQIVNKLIQFLVTMVHSSRGQGLGLKRHYSLMLDNSPHHTRKLAKLEETLADNNAEPVSLFPTVRGLTSLDPSGRSQVLMTLHAPQETLSPAGPVIHELDPADLLDDSDSTIDDPNLMPQDLCEAVVNEDAHSPLSYCSSSEKGGQPGPQELLRLVKDIPQSTAVNRTVLGPRKANRRTKKKPLRSTNKEKIAGAPIDKKPLFDGSNKTHYELFRSDETHYELFRSNETHYELFRSDETHYEPFKSNETHYELLRSDETHYELLESDETHYEPFKSNETHYELLRSNEDHYELLRSNETHYELLRKSDETHYELLRSDETHYELFKSNETHYELLRSNEDHYELLRSNEDHYELLESNETHLELLESDETHYELFKSNETHYELLESDETHYEPFKSNETHYELLRSNEDHYELLRSNETHYELDETHYELFKSNETHYELLKSNEDHYELLRSNEDHYELLRSDETHYELLRSDETHYELLRSNEDHYELLRSDETHYELLRSDETHYELLRSNEDHYELLRSDETHCELFKSNETHYELFKSNETHYELFKSNETHYELFKSNETHYELFKNNETHYELSNETHYELFKSNETHYELLRSNKTHYELFKSDKTHYELLRSNKTHYELFRSNETHYELLRSNKTHYELFRSNETHYELSVLPPSKQEDADDSLGVQINIVPEESDSLDDATKEALSVFNNMVAEADQPETVPEEVPEPEEPCQLPDLTVACAGTDQSLDRDSLDSQVDCMQTDLDTLKELLKGENYSLDANTLLGVRPSSLGLRHQLELHQSTVLSLFSHASEEVPSVGTSRTPPWSGVGHPGGLSRVSTIRENQGKRELAGNLIGLPFSLQSCSLPLPSWGTTLVKNQTAGYREIELFNEDPLTYDDIPPAENDGDEPTKQNDDSGRWNRRRTVATQSRDGQRSAERNWSSINGIVLLVALQGLSSIFVISVDLPSNELMTYNPNFLDLTDMYGNQDLGEWILPHSPEEMMSLEELNTPTTFPDSPGLAPKK